jgi:hypothetical protein
MSKMTTVELDLAQGCFRFMGPTPLVERFCDRSL